MHILCGYPPLLGPEPIVVPDSDMLEVESFVAESACVEIGLKHDIGNLDKLAVEIGWGGHREDFEKGVSGRNCIFQLVVKHDLITLIIVLFIAW